MTCSEVDVLNYSMEVVPDLNISNAIITNEYSSYLKNYFVNYKKLKLLYRHLASTNLYKLSISK